MLHKHFWEEEITPFFNFFRLFCPVVHHSGNFPCPSSFFFVNFDILIRWARIQVIPIPFRIGSRRRSTWSRSPARSRSCCCSRFGLPGSSRRCRRRCTGPTPAHGCISPVKWHIAWPFVILYANEWFLLIRNVYAYDTLLAQAQAQAQAQASDAYRLQVPPYIPIISIPRLCFHFSLES